MSKKTVYFRQCRMEKKTEAGSVQQMSWIPDRFAVVGKTLKLKNEDKTWEDGWIVMQAGGNKLAQDELPDYHQDIKGHRKATGDALPKK